MDERGCHRGDGRVGIEHPDQGTDRPGINGGVGVEEEHVRIGADGPQPHVDARGEAEVRSRVDVHGAGGLDDVPGRRR
jgi:hypothetical protein